MNVSTNLIVIVIHVFPILNPPPSSLPIPSYCDRYLQYKNVPNLHIVHLKLTVFCISYISIKLEAEEEEEIL